MLVGPPAVVGANEGWMDTDGAGLLFSTGPASDEFVMVGAVGGVVKADDDGTLEKDGGGVWASTRTGMLVGTEDGRSSDGLVVEVVNGTGDGTNVNGLEDSSADGADVAGASVKVLVLGPPV